MANTTIVRSWSAITVGVFFTGVTGWVLMADVLQHGAPLTTKHVMTLAVLAGTIYFGHTLWRELRAWRLGTAFGCTALFLAGTTTCVLMSAGRNAEVVTTKVLAANSVNTTRASAQKDRDEAKARYLAAMRAEEAECGSGQGEKCWSKRTTTKLRREDADAAESRMLAQAPEQIANSDIRAAAELVARLPYVTAPVPTVEALLQLLYPFLQSLFCEVGAIVGFSIGLGHGKLSAPRTPSGARKAFRKAATMPERVPESLPEAVERVPEATAVIAALERVARPVTNSELAQLLGCSEGESSKRVASMNGKISKVKIGRCVAISLNRRH